MTLKEKIESKLDYVWVGVVLGLIFPFIGFYSSVLFYEIAAKDVWFIFTLEDSEYFSDILVFILLPNMFLFWVFFFYLNTDRASKGLIASTLLVLGFLFLMAK